MSGALDEISVAIGRLEEGMRFLAKQVHANQETSTEEHRKVHDIVTAMSESVRVIAAKVAKMEPLTEDYQEKRAEARGAAKLVYAVYALCGGFVAVIGGKLWDIFITRPHP